MKSTNANEAAFARPYSEQQPGDRLEPMYAQDGMTMREWLASQALAGILAAHSAPGMNLPAAAKAARWAFSYADFMLAEAKKPAAPPTGDDVPL
jgi:hypothetical protein